MVWMAIVICMEVIEELALLHAVIAANVLAAAEPEHGIIENVCRTMRRES